MSKLFFIQQNFTVGDIDKNAQRLIDGATQAAAAGADIALSPELSLCGYPAEDMLYFPFFLSTIRRALRQIATAIPAEIALLVGLPWEEDGALYNACALLRGGEVVGVHKKSRLPNSSVFDEKRYFSTTTDEPLLVFEAGGDTYTVLICEEIWTTEQAAKVAAVANNTLVLNGSPFVVGKQKLRHDAAAAFARAGGGNVFYANLIGGQDELVFDGASFVVNAAGELVGQLPAFAEQNAFANDIAPYPKEDAAVYTTLKLGLRDYVRKSGFDGVLLGLSGGVDSALVATLAVDALGSEQVTAVMMPTKYTSAESLADAAQLAENLGVEYLSLSPVAAIDGAESALAPYLRDIENDVTKENIQARTRGLLLMGLSNNRRQMLLATGNKSEMACGYATLYGDMNGGFAPIKDLLKTAVWQMCRYRNDLEGSELIPQRIITRPPTAELRPNQTDQDTLPPYEDIDAMLTDHIRYLPPQAMEEKYDKTLLRDFYRRLMMSEYKRRQSPLGTKVSECAFGRDWRMPIANRFKYD